jgi:hypothetical protein
VLFLFLFCFWLSCMLFLRRLCIAVVFTEVGEGICSSSLLFAPIPTDGFYAARVITGILTLSL